jgi:hypothetical protein
MRLLRSGILVVAAVAALLVWQLPAKALDVSGTPSPVTGWATWFTGLGSPYGGCGLPQANVDSQNFLALNVQNSPGVYTNLPRPIPAADASEIGMFDNGLNCGRWVQVTIGDNCDGTNTGSAGQPFCTPGTLAADRFNGATLDMVVADSCDDDNAWCKDNPYHIDLAQASLNQFVLSGQTVGDMYPDSWNNRQVTWQFIPAPHYTGNINIGFIQGAQPYWPAVAISHLPNGIHGVNYYADGSWVSATMDSDMGDDYIIGPTSGTGTGGTNYEIQVIDSSGNLVNNGDVYSFSIPTSCTDGCSAAYTPVSYTTSAGPSPSPSPPPSSTAGSCSLSSSLTTSWSDGYQLQFTVTDTGTSALTGWTAAFGFADTSESVSGSWNAATTQSGTKVSAVNESYNGSLSPGGSATFGMTVNGPNSSLSGLTCAPT